MTVPQFRAAKAGAKLAVVTAYDFTAGLIADAAGADCVLVGDSLGMVVQGHANPIPVSLAQVAYPHAMRRPRRQTGPDCGGPALRQLPVLAPAGGDECRETAEGRGPAVKVEGGRRMVKTIEAIVAADIPVMGHVGLTPQSVHALGGFKVQRDGDALLADSAAVAAAGAFAIVVECVPSALAEKVTYQCPVPTIGIGAGPSCDGQVLVWHDLLGLYDGIRPKFVKRYAELGRDATGAIKAYCDEVRAGTFPGPGHQFT